MNLEPFLLERYFARYEFSARFLLSPSDCETLAMADLIALADSEAAEMWRGLKLGYTESQGHPLLRAEITRLYDRISAENILTAVPEEAILIAMHVLLRPGDRVVSVWPAYQSLYAIPRALGCEVVPWPIEAKPAHNGEPAAWRLDLQRLAEILPGARLLVLNFPHNPTGLLPDAQTFAAIFKLAQQAGVTVFCDEMYRGLEHRPEARLPAACDLDERAISLSGLSKTYGLPGLRSGWLVSQDRNLIAQFQAYKDYTTICPSAPGEILSLIALRARERILARNLDLVLNNLELAQRFFFDRADEFEWLHPGGGSTVFPRWLGQGSVEDFCQQAVERSGVMIVPDRMFETGGNHFRVGLGRADFPAVLETFGNFLLERA